MIDRAKFMAEILKFAVVGTEPEEVINKGLEFLGSELGADRSYIFEQDENGRVDNTYEWCAPGVSPEIDNLQDLPREVCDVWYDEYKRSGVVFIEDLEEYKSVSLPMYEVLKPQGIKTLISGPLELDGEFVGFFGVDNPPLELMEEVSRILVLLEYSFCLMLRFRDNTRALEKRNHTDVLTGLRNRAAFNAKLEKYEQNSVPKDLIIVAMDLNGLKRVNDTLGHEAGDELIKASGICMKRCFEEYDGHVYRVGGDEFFALIHTETEKIPEMEKKLKEISEGYRGKYINGVSISCGFTSAKEFPGITLEELERIADKRMYEAKSEYYKSTGFDRRKR